MLAKKLFEDISNILGTALGNIPRPVPLHAPVISDIDSPKSTIVFLQVGFHLLVVMLISSRIAFAR